MLMLFSLLFFFGFCLVFACIIVFTAFERPPVYIPPPLPHAFPASPPGGPRGRGRVSRPR
mgnify:CR=1 FL=1